MKRRRLGTETAHVGPHEFRRLGRFLHRRKCRACYLPEHEHPTRRYVMARPMGDRS